ncbi:hypothetical protein KR222_008539, partial [Zaprionus bogoriensis]
MPNDLIKPKGPYTLSWRSRRLEERQKEWSFRHNLRQRRREPPCTPMRLLKLISYFLGFSLCLALFSTWYFILLVDYRISLKHPSELKQVSLSSTPGKFADNVKVIRYKEFTLKASTPYVKQINNFMNRYGKKGLTYLEGCNLDNNWGYLFNEPCVLLKLNLAQDFEALTYEDAIALPSSAPEKLYYYLMELPADRRINRIWLSCEFDGEHKEAEVNYIPERSFDSANLFAREHVYFTTLIENFTAFESQEDPAMRRVIGVQFRNLPLNQDVYVTCSVWAKNIRVELASVFLCLHI